ncbi:MAG TPA: plasmid pRiA4b ORF-3 family protein [Thermoanaerobaculia bacterium]|nr:plasmid pRiA4b ORF-3 family protein [Thermoanaerobaculia bacterium]
MLEPKRPARGRLENDAVESSRHWSDPVCLRIVLLEIFPPVWRRLRVPGQMTLRQLHAVLQCAMGWSGIEAHRFRVGEVLYGKMSEGGGLRDSRWVTVADVAAALGGGSFRYELLADETWEHDIRIEGVLEARTDNQVPVCLGGEHSWPSEAGDTPEDSADRVDFMTAERLDAGAFDLEAVNRALARLR